MKFSVSVIVTALLSFAGCLFLPWWFIAIAAFLVAVAIPQKPGKSFLAGFIALFLLWGILSFWLSNNNNHVLAHKVSLLIIKVDNPYYLMLVTAFICPIVGGMAALSGSYVRRSK